MRQSKTQVRNLYQYKGKTDEEFEQIWLEKYAEREPTPEVDENRIDEMMIKFAEDYDLTDMNINDTIALKQIARMSIELDELQKMLTKARIDNELTRVQAIDRVIKNIVSNISTLQMDLNISRRSRQSDKGETLHEYLPAILKKAKSFLKERLAYVYCPECKMLVVNAWFTEWDDNNVLCLTCPREECRFQFEVTSKSLARKRNKNIDNVLPV